MLKALKFYKTLWNSFGTLKRRAVLLFVVIIIAAIGESINIGILAPMLSYFLKQKSLEYSLFLFLEQHFDRNAIFILILLVYFLLVIITNAVKILMEYLSEAFVWNLRNQWTSRIITKYLNMPYHRMISHKQGYLVNNAIEEPLRASKLLNTFILFNSTLLFLFGIYIMLFLYNPLMTMVFTVFAGVLVLLIRKRLVKISVDSGNKRVAYQQQLHGLMTESIAGFKEVKIFQNENSIFAKVNDILGKYKIAYIRFGVFRVLPGILVEVLFAFLLVTISIIYLQVNKNFNLSDFIPLLVLFIVGGAKIFAYFSKASSESLNMLNLNPSYKKVMDLMKTDEANENRVALSEQHQALHANGLCLKRAIALKNVTFSYGEKIILRNVSLKIKANKTTFIIGRSGKGKTTLAYLLLGLVKLNEGSIFFDSAIIDDSNIYSLLDITSYVSQDNFLFHQSIRDNIIMGNRNLNEKDFHELCVMLQIDDFVGKLPMGYDTTVGDRGDKFSEGQKQRIALARAIAKEAQLYIMDEPTSSLDKETSRILENIISYLSKKKKTIVIITHKENDLRLADEVIKL